MIQMNGFLVFTLFILNISKPLKSLSVENGCWLWNIVVFDLDPAFAEYQRLLIQDRMRHISESTCLRFIDLREYAPLEVPKYLQIRQSSSKYCRTITEQNNGSVVVTIELGTGCTTDRGILHELVHSLGFRHEHQRVDRKCYVKVFISKVTQVGAFTVDFDHPDNDWLERFPYDKLSIMHYFRSNKLKSRNERWYEWEPLGNSNGHLTTLDIWKINYKHCSHSVHYCDVYPENCAIMENDERILDCKRN